MNRLTDNDRNFGPLTLAKWSKTFSAYIESGDDEDPQSTVLVVAFGWALRCRIWNWLCRPWRARFGVSLSDMGNGYDFLQCFFGPQTHDSSTTKSWSKHLPWKQWDHVRCSIYTPTGVHFYTEPRGASFREYFGKKEECPKVHFGFEDYDGELIVATCLIEEREWHKGSGWFKWLRWFSAPKIRRSLNMAFSEEVGPGKGSWKGGTIGHGIDMLPGESSNEAFQRYCAKTHERKGRQYNLRFIGPCASPRPRERATANNSNAGTQRRRDENAPLGTEAQSRRSLE